MKKGPLRKWTDGIFDGIKKHINIYIDKGSMVLFSHYLLEIYTIDIIVSNEIIRSLGFAQEFASE